MEKNNTKQSAALPEQQAEQDVTTKQPTPALPQITISPPREVDLPIIPGPLNLVTAVASLRTARKAHLASLAREANLAFEKAYTAALPSLVAEQEQYERERRAEMRRARREATFPARDKTRLEKARREREARKRDLQRMSMDELWGKIEDTIARESDLTGRMTPKPGETHEEQVARLKACLVATSRLHGIGFARLMAGPIRYVEGIPINTVHTTPALVSIMFPIRRLPSAEDACLNCQAKGLRCSHCTLDIFTHDLPSSACTRCVRAGDKCVVKWKRHPRKPRHYFLADEGWKDNEERKTVVGELWERMEEKSREERKALPAWHQNDREENKKDPEYKRKTWWHQLGYKSTKW